MGATLSDAAYAAGFFDGEGTVYAARRGKTAKTPTLLVCIGNTNLDVLLWHQERWGGSIQKRPSVKARHKDQYQWVLAPRAAAAFLRDIEPFLVIKAEVAAAALEMADLMQRPRAERIDYARRKWTGRQWVPAPQVRPEFRAQVDAVHARIQALNVRGAPHNARRSAA